jgi:hypothetical protein
MHAELIRNRLASSIIVRDTARVPGSLVRTSSVAWVKR